MINTYISFIFYIKLAILEICFDRPLQTQGYNIRENKMNIDFEKGFVHPKLVQLKSREMRLLMKNGNLEDDNLEISSKNSIKQ